SFSSSTLAAGTHTIYFSVKDNDGAWSKEVSSTLTISGATTSTETTPTETTPTASNQRPVVSITSISPSPATVGSSVSFKGTGSDPDGKIVKYIWKSDRDGWLGDSTSSASFSTSKLSAGTHTIWLLVEDNDGKWTGDRSTLVIKR
ncbi:PKD domain-containing protein, partial [Methanolobus sp.]|uniref:PKD domain-containing protein n=1 Tax=Methanolobus sp. TaxID=1874737 RepID=UPI0025D250C6